MDAEKLFKYAAFTSTFICIILFIKNCTGGSAEKHSTEIDTVYLPSKDKWHTLPSDTVRVPYYVYRNFTDTIYFPPIHDTVKYVQDCQVENRYRDTVSNDSIRVYYDLAVKDNRLKSIDLGYKWIAPTMEIHKVTERQIICLGADFTTGMRVYPSVYWDTKKALFGVGYEPFKKEVKFGAYFRIKLWKRK